MNDFTVAAGFARLHDGLIFYDGDVKLGLHFVSVKELTMVGNLTAKKVVFYQSTKTAHSQMNGACHEFSFLFEGMNSLEDVVLIFYLIHRDVGAL